LPFKTVAKVNTLNLVAGNKVFFRRGDTFIGGLVSKPGAVGNPVKYGAYGTGADPKLTGLTSVTLVSIGGGIYESTTAVSTLTTASIVLVNGAQKAMGRYPNTGWLTISSHTGNTSVTTASTIIGSFTGGQVVIRKLHWVFDVNTITSNNSNTVNYTPLPGSATQYNPLDGYGFFIQNHPATLDTFGEWYYDPTTKKLRVFVGGASVPTVQIANIDHIISTSGKATFENLQIEGANQNGVNITGSDVTVNACNIKYCGKNGVYQTSSFNNYTITNNTITFCNNSPVYFQFGGSTHTISNNILTDSGLIAGAGNYGDLGQEGIIDMGSNVTISNNTLQRIGYSGIRFANKANILIEKNLIDTYCLVKDDGGGIYTWNNAAVPDVPTNNVVRYNIILNAIGNASGTDKTTPEAYGIYMDDNSSQVQILNNTIAYCYYAIVFHNGHHMSLLGNNVYDSHAIALFWKDNAAVSITGQNVQDNVFYAKSGQNSARFWDVDGGPGNSIASFGVFDNNYYSRDINVIYPTFGTGAINNTYSLAAFKPVFGLETNSTQIPTTGDRFEYNDTTSNKVVSLGKTMVDSRGVIYPSTITLAPFTSAILFDNSSAYTWTQKTYAGGTIAGVSAGFYEYLPEGYNSAGDATKYPVIFYFHGSGEIWSGTGPATLNDLLVNPIPKLIQAGTFPKMFTTNGLTKKFIIICPQTRDFPSPNSVQLIVNQIMPNYRIDTKRVYFTGLSMGGGTATKYVTNTAARSQFVAAVGSVCGAYNPGTWNPGDTALVNLAQNNVAWWGTHNIDDATVPVAETNNTYDQILNSSPDILPHKTIFTSALPNYPTAPFHNAWTRSYDVNYDWDGLGNNLYEWFLRYSK